MKNQPLKTNAELLAMLPEPIKEKALGNVILNQAGKYPIEDNTPAEALLCSFIWEKTDEGYDYWNNVHKLITNHNSKHHEG